MAKSDPEALAAALRANLKRRKERMRAAQAGDITVEPVEGAADEEGDVPPPRDGERDGAWVNIGSKKP
jgi:hypothetical protein